MIFFLLLISKPYHTAVVDGYFGDWLNDEAVSSAVEENDSTFLDNEIERVYVTWDKENLYLGVKYRISNNGLIVFFERADGFNDLTMLNTWNRKARFLNYTPRFFWAGWDGSDGNFYEITSTQTVRELGITKKSVKNSGTELKIPFETLFGSRDFPKNAKVRIAVSIVTGDVGSDSFGNYGFLAGDSFPDSSEPLNNFSTSTLTNFYEINFDNDGDSIPDNYYLGSIKDFSFEIDRKFIPERAAMSISIVTETPGNLTLRIFRLDGSYVGTVLENQLVSGSFNYSWDGIAGGLEIPAGIYIMSANLTGDGGGIKNRAFVLIR